MYLILSEISHIIVNERAKGEKHKETLNSKWMNGGLKISAVKNHYSLLHRSSERAGILDYCKENGITFYSYMVLEQGALTGQYDEANPFPEGTGRGKGDVDRDSKESDNDGSGRCESAESAERKGGAV